MVERSSDGRVIRKPLQPWQAVLPPGHVCGRDDYTYSSLGEFAAAHRGRVAAQSMWRLAQLTRGLPSRFEPNGGPPMSFADALEVIRPVRNGWPSRASVIDR
jgi:hypothetical protein